MEYRSFGTAGLRVSAVGLGCNPFGNEVDVPTAARIVDQALELGVNYFDTADTYFDGRSEDYLGRALAGKRGRAIIATKVGNRSGAGANEIGASRAHILANCEASLRRLQTDYIDVYQIHTPDRATPTEETMRALDDLVKQGKVRYIGCSNYFEWEVAESQGIARANNLTPFASTQDFYNLLYRDVEKRMVPLCLQYGLALIPYMPLAAALLTGTYHRNVAPPSGTRGAGRPSYNTFNTDRNWSVQEALVAFAAERGWNLPRLALAWLLAQKAVPTVIAGADRPEHVADNVQCLDIHLTAEDLAEIDRITLVDEDRSVAPIYGRHLPGYRRGLSRLDPPTVWEQRRRA